MIDIVDIPVYEQTYTDPATKEPRVFHYNVLAVQSDVRYRFCSHGAAIESITRGPGGFATLTLREDITEYLNEVARSSGSAPQVHLIDDQPGVSYAGTYRAQNIRTSDGVTQMELYNPTNNNGTFVAEKTYAEDGSSQLIYRYRNIFTFDVVKVETINGQEQEAILSTVRQQMEATGGATLNVSEAVRPYTPSTGSIGVKVKVRTSDYFGNTEQTETPTAHFVDAYNPEINYGTYVLFNPNTGGVLLPTTGRELIYGDSDIYPFFVNFILNDDWATVPVTGRLLLTMYRDDSAVDTIRLDFVPKVGLNVINLWEYAALYKQLSDIAPDTIGVSVFVGQINVGSFLSEEFDKDFALFTTGGSFVSPEYRLSCRYYVLDNRRDFYFSFDNGIGGRTPLLCSQFTKSTEPEIIALRNASDISNSVSRETERVTLTFPKLSLPEVEMLFGYNVSSLRKNHGIYESRNITRHGSEGDSKLWVIESGTYEQSNGDLYRDCEVVLYRPLSSGFDTLPPTRLSVSVKNAMYDSIEAEGTILQANGIVIDRGFYLNGQKTPVESTDDTFTATFNNLSAEDVYILQSYAFTTRGESRSAPLSVVLADPSLLMYIDAATPAPASDDHKAKTWGDLPKDYTLTLVMTPDGTGMATIELGGESVRVAVPTAAPAVVACLVDSRNRTAMVYVNGLLAARVTDIDSDTARAAEGLSNLAETQPELSGRIYAATLRTGLSTVDQIRQEWAYFTKKLNV